jgi:hypothetical protein
MKKSILPCAAVAAILSGPNTVIAAGELPCLGTKATVNGKILNNSLNQLETLGVVHITIGGQQNNQNQQNQGNQQNQESISLSCGDHGQINSPVDITHIVVCDDSVRVPGSTDTIHSQAILDTQIQSFAPPLCSHTTPVYTLTPGTIQEISYPQSGRGIFASGGGGSIFVQGTLNCAGAIFLTFSGTACLASH